MLRKPKKVGNVTVWAEFNADESKVHITGPFASIPPQEVDISAYRAAGFDNEHTLDAVLHLVGVGLLYREVGNG
jgi:hypothetical protein